MVVYQGAMMEEHATLLEHCLILGGDSVEAGTTWQGTDASYTADAMIICVLWCRVARLPARAAASGACFHGAVMWS